MSAEWKLKRTAQCAKCPWRKDVDPHDIPNGYCETKHQGLAKTIAKGDPLEQLRGSVQHVMACHEMDDAHCVGWLANQLGPGNNIVLRLQMRTCTNANKLRLVGEQHERFEDTLPATES
jgi:hypothetical protein